MELKEKIKLIRNHLSLTQDQMAEKLGLNSESRRARISEWEAGRGEPKRDKLINYARIGKIDIRKLIDDDDTIEL
jgi:transcriptional regulator with XRE-family HTH domain